MPPAPSTGPRCGRHSKLMSHELTAQISPNADQMMVLHCLLTCLSGLLEGWARKGQIPTLLICIPKTKHHKYLTNVCLLKGRKIISITLQLIAAMHLKLISRCVPYSTIFVLESHAQCPETFSLVTVGSGLPESLKGPEKPSSYTQPPDNCLLSS